MSKFLNDNHALGSFLEECGIEASPLHDEFGVMLTLDSTIGIGSVSSELPWIRPLVEKYGVVVIKGQRELADNPREYVELMERILGKPHGEVFEDAATIAGFPEIQVLGSVSSNTGAHDGVHPAPSYIPAHAPETPASLGEWMRDRKPCSVTDWHSDEPWEDRPVKYVVALSALSSGPNATCFSSTAALYERSSESVRQRLERTETTFAPPPWLPCEAGRKVSAGHATVQQGPHGPSFYLCIDSTVGIDGFDEDAAIKLVWDLTKDCMRPEHVYTHRWEEGDLVIWDNTRTLHARTPYSVGGTDRILYRMRVLGGRNERGARGPVVYGRPTRPARRSRRTSHLGFLNNNKIAEDLQEMVAEVESS